MMSSSAEKIMPIRFIFPPSKNFGRGSPWNLLAKFHVTHNLFRYPARSIACVFVEEVLVNRRAYFLVNLAFGLQPPDDLVPHPGLGLGFRVVHLQDQLQSV